MSSAVRMSGRVAAMLLAAAAAALAIPAQGADDNAAERARLAEERSAAEARFVDRDAECRQRFVVSACVAEARRARRTALDSISARQRVLDDARRQHRAVERRTALAAKAADDAGRERERGKKAASAPAAAAIAGSAASSPRVRPAARSGEAKGSAPKASPATRRQLEDRNRAAFATRQKDAARHREEAVDAAILRMEKHPPAKSLPVPSAVRAASSP